MSSTPHPRRSGSVLAPQVSTVALAAAASHATLRLVQRHIVLDGCLNFRDLGGYPTASGKQVCWRQLFRSDSLQLLSTADVRLLREQLGLGCVIDLRSTAELRKEG